MVLFPIAEEIVPYYETRLAKKPPPFTVRVVTKTSAEVKSKSAKPAINKKTDIHS